MASTKSEGWALEGKKRKEKEKEMISAKGSVGIKTFGQINCLFVYQIIRFDCIDLNFYSCF